MYANNCKKLDVLYVADATSLSSKVGDLVHVSEFVCALEKKGFRIRLLIRGDVVPEDLNSKNIALYKLPDLRIPWSLFLYFISVPTILTLSIIKRPAFIYARDNAINIVTIVGKLLKIPVFIEVNGCLDTDSPRLARALATFFLRRVVDITYKSADAIIIPSQNMFSFLGAHKIATQKIFVVPNGVNSEVFLPIDKTFCRTKLGFKEYTYLCFVGNLAPWQGIDKAILALYYLKKESKNPNVKLVIAGDGILRKYLQKLISELDIEEDVMFLGAVPHANVPYIINACDICIAPFTAWRNKKIGVSPLKLFEYLSCGKPVIASSVPGTEIIKELDAGILVEPDNIEALKEAYKEAIKKLPYWEKRAHILHKEIATNHSWNNRVDTILRIIQQIIHRKHKFSD